MSGEWYGGAAADARCPGRRRGGRIGSGHPHPTPVGSTRKERRHEPGDSPEYYHEVLTRIINNGDGAAERLVRQGVEVVPIVAFFRVNANIAPAG
jgi:hypothetical protein